MSAVAVVLICAGLGFLVVSAVGIVLFPDFYTRAHVIATSETFGVMLVLAGVVLHHRFEGGTLRLALLVVFAAIANPTAAHALARAYAMEQDPTPEELEVPDGWSTSEQAPPPATGRDGDAGAPNGGAR